MRPALPDKNESGYQRSFRFDGWEIMLAEPNEAPKYSVQSREVDDASNSWKV
jgi:hypothetical protein